MTAGLPLQDPQFWLVTGAALAALALLGARARRRRRRAAGAPPHCAHCDEAPLHLPDRGPDPEARPRGAAPPPR